MEIIFLFYKLLRTCYIRFGGLDEVRSKTYDLWSDLWLAIQAWIHHLTFLTSHS